MTLHWDRQIHWSCDHWKYRFYPPERSPWLWLIFASSLYSYSDYEIKKDVLSFLSTHYRFRLERRASGPLSGMILLVLCTFNAPVLCSYAFRFLGRPRGAHKAKQYIYIKVNIINWNISKKPCIFILDSDGGGRHFLFLLHLSDSQVIKNKHKKSPEKK